MRCDQGFPVAQPILRFRAFHRFFILIFIVNYFHFFWCFCNANVKAIMRSLKTQTIYFLMNQYIFLIRLCFLVVQKIFCGYTFLSRRPDVWGGGRVQYEYNEYNVYSSVCLSIYIYIVYIMVFGYLRKYRFFFRYADSIKVGDAI